MLDRSLKQAFLFLVVVTCIFLSTIWLRNTSLLGSYEYGDFDNHAETLHLRTVRESNKTAKKLKFGDRVNMATELSKWTPDWQTNHNITDLFIRRATRIRNICEKYKHKMIKRPDKTPRVLLSSKYELTMCVVPKISSTYWKRLYSQISKVTHSKHQYHSVDLGFRKSEQYKHPIYAYITRNPWHRFVSVYMEKMSGYASSHERNKFLRFCMKSKELILSFEEFLSCAVRRMEKGVYNIHWEPVYTYCDICHHQYTAPVALENMKTEASFLLESAGISNATQMMDDVREHTIRKVEKNRLSSKYIDYYKQLTDSTLIPRFRDLYQIELEMFNYPLSPFTEMSSV